MIPVRAFAVFTSLLVAVGNSGAEDISGHLAGGEFAAAARVAAASPAADRAGWLAQIAVAQGGSGESAAANATVRQINSASDRAAAVDNLRAAGGGSLADFQSLIDLIQTTVVPETWDLLGGPSTMREYPQGVYVDAQGTVENCETFATSDAVEDLKSLLNVAPLGSRQTSGSWRAASKLRCVSLRRLLDEWTQTQINGAQPTAAMIHLAGLSEVQYLFIDGDEIVIAGPVGGIESFQGWYRDRANGRGTLRLDFLATCLASALGQQPFGCTIDPSTEGLQRAAVVAADVQSQRMPIGKAAEAMSSALGMQRVEVFGTAGDTPLGYLMVEADRHMKELALGIHPMPRGVKNYVDMIDESIDRGPPNDLLLRLWFTAAASNVRADQDRKVFEISGTPIRLSGQNERAMADGARGNLTRDFRSEAFVAEFNDHWGEIRSAYPVYGALEAIYRTASIAELTRRFANTPEQRSLIEMLAHRGSSTSELRPIPRRIASIAKLHSVRHGRKVHHVLIASGGVAVDSRQTLTAKLDEYPALESIRKPDQFRPKVLQRWWWDAL